MNYGTYTALRVGSLLFAAFCAPFAHSYSLIVKVKAGANGLQIADRAERTTNVRALSAELAGNVSGVSTVRALPITGVAIVQVADKDGEQNVRDALKDHPLVEYVEVNKEWRTAALQNESAPSAQAISPWLSDVLGLSESTPDASQSYSGNSPVIVAVVDTGATKEHPYLSPALAINKGEANKGAGVDDDANGYVDDIYGANVINKNGAIDEYYTDHGSHVSGLVKMIRDQAIQSHPEAIAVQVLPIRFISEAGVGSTAGAIAAMEYAASRGARVVNASWGARGEDAFSQALYDTMADLYNSHDILFSVAAGNADASGPNNNDNVPYFPASFNIPSLLSVASVTAEYDYNQSGHPVYSGLELSNFSNYGVNSVQIAAVGSYRDANYDESGVYSANAHFTSSSDYYIRKKGTSMAAPVIAGVAGVIRAINPSLTAYEVKELILSTAHRMSGLSSISSSSVVDAAAAFSAAHSAVSHGAHPGISGDAYTVNSSSGGSHDAAAVGGCGAILSQGGSGGDGPMGGNSVLLFAALYAVSVLAGKIRRKIQSHSV